MDGIINIVQSIGFPAAMCVGLSYFVWKQTQFNNELYRELKTTIEQNTQVIYELKETVGNLKIDVDKIKEERD